MNLCMGTCRRRFRHDFSSNHQFFNKTVILVFEKHFHFGGDTSDYVTMLNSSSMKQAFNYHKMIY